MGALLRIPVGRSTLLGGLLLVAAASVPAPAQMQTATLNATVLDAQTGQPLEGAQIRLTSAAMGGITKADGRVTIAGIRPANHIVVVVRLGYRPEQMLVKFEPGAVVDGEILMQVAPLELSKVEVMAESRSVALVRRGFYERRESGWGYFMDEDELAQRRRGGARLTDILGTFPGLSLQYDPRTGQPMIFSRRRDGLSGGCMPTLFVDGMRAPPARGGVPMNLDHFVVANDISAIEVYPGSGTAPVEFRHGTCGSIVIWTKSF